MTTEPGNSRAAADERPPRSTPPSSVPITTCLLPDIHFSLRVRVGAPQNLRASARCGLGYRVSL